MHPTFHRRAQRLGWVRLVFSLGMGLVSSIMTVYIKSMVHTDAATSLVAGLMNVIAVLASFALATYLGKHKSKWLMSASLFTFATAYILFGWFSVLWIFAIGTVFYVVWDVIRKHSFGELVRHQGTKKQLFGLEGLMYTVSNIGWLLGPLLAIFAFRTTLSNGFFIAAGLMSLAAIMVLWSKLKDATDVTTKKETLLTSIKLFAQHPKMRLAYLINIGLCMWWPVMFVFIPLLIIKNGLPTALIGTVLFATMVPVVVIEALVSRYGKNMGERFFFKLGFGILAASAIAVFIVDNPHWVLSILAASGVGVGFIEPTQEVYFFKKVKPKDEKRFFSLFLSSGDIGPIITKFLGAALLIFLPIKAVILVIGVFMAGLFFLSNKT